MDQFFNNNKIMQYNFHDKSNYFGHGDFDLDHLNAPFKNKEKDKIKKCCEILINRSLKLPIGDHILLSLLSKSLTLFHQNYEIL